MIQKEYQVLFRKKFLKLIKHIHFIGDIRNRNTLLGWICPYLSVKENKTKTIV